MNNAKWLVFGLCFLAVMAGAGVWWVEQKIAQVTGVVNGAVDRVQDTVNAPLEAMSDAYTTFDRNAAHAIEKFGADFNEALTPYGTWYQQNINDPIEELLGLD